MRRLYQPLHPELLEPPVRSAGVHEYRAALLGITLATDRRGDPSPLLDPAIRPHSAQESVQLIQDLSPINPKLQERAKAQAGFLLARSTFIDERKDSRASLEQLLGQQETRKLEDVLERETEEKRENLTEELLRDVLTRLPEYPPSGPVLKAAANPLEQPKHRLLRSTKATSKLYLHTLLTRVNIESNSNRSIEKLAEVLDPQNWTCSPFWVDAYRVELDKKTHQFNPTSQISPASKVPIGQSWHGHFYEHIEWNWNLATVSSFKNYLIVDYLVNTPDPKEPNEPIIKFDFSLHSCAGGRLYALELDRGVDADWGHQYVKFPPSAQAGPPWRIITEKNVRFSDILARGMPFEGLPGAGQLLTFMAPAIVGLWMNDLLEYLDLYVPGLL